EGAESFLDNRCRLRAVPKQFGALSSVTCHAGGRRLVPVGEESVLPGGGGAEDVPGVFEVPLGGPGVTSRGVLFGSGREQPRAQPWGGALAGGGVGLVEQPER